jgi:hypothetical protein
MRWIAEITQPESARFVIEHDKLAGFYVYVYRDGRLIADYLQDTLDIAKRFAFEKFNVHPGIWMQVDGSFRWVADHQTEKDLGFIIAHDLVMGFELIVTKAGSRINSTTDRRYWKASLQEMKEFVQIEYGVLPDNWRSA